MSDLRTGHCVRSGYCCQVATCAAGRYFGAPEVGCTFLGGERPGEHWCRLAVERPELKTGMAIGSGCSSTLFNDRREEVFRHLGEGDLPQLRESLKVLTGTPGPALWP